MSTFNDQATEANKAKEEEEARKLLDKANKAGEIRIIMNRMRGVTSLQELRSLEDQAEDLAEGNNTLIQQIKKAAETYEEKIEERQAQATLISREKNDNESHLPKDLMIGAITGALGIYAAAIAAEEKEYEKGKDTPNLAIPEGKTIKDSAFGEQVRAEDAQTKKQEHRETSISRVDALQNLNEQLQNFDNLSAVDKSKVVEAAKEHKINFKRTDDGQLVVDDKSQKTLAKVSALDQQEVTKKREERKANDDKDHVMDSLSQGSLGSLFGDDDFATEPTISTTKPKSSAEESTTKAKNNGEAPISEEKNPNLQQESYSSTQSFVKKFIQSSKPSAGVKPDTTPASIRHQIEERRNQDFTKTIPLAKR